MSGDIRSNNDRLHFHLRDDGFFDVAIQINGVWFIRRLGARELIFLAAVRQGF